MIVGQKQFQQKRPKVTLTPSFNDVGAQTTRFFYEFVHRLPEFFEVHGFFA
jgi:hypothetical protein